MSDDHDGDVGREIIRFVTIKLLVAGIANQHGFKVVFVKFANAAMGAFAFETLPHGFANGAFTKAHNTCRHGSSSP